MAQAILTIHLDAIQKNYRSLCDRVKPGACAAVVKADAYGLGVAQIAPFLAQQGVTEFFVATPEEGIALRTLGIKTKIYILNGIFAKQEKDFLHHGLVPCLNNKEQLELWPHPQKIVHVDTGLNRLGFNANDFMALDDALDVATVMSHLACADAPEHEMNAKQRDVFVACAAKYPNARKSLAASDGIFCGTRFHFDLVRPGAALYGLNPRPGLDNPMHQVMRLQAPILQLRDVQSDGVVGYGASANVAKGQRLATVALGYADGFLRALGNKAHLYYGDRALPVMGRVSMDLITVDVGDTALQVGDYLDVFSPYQTPDQLARMAGTIDYELFTALGNRFERIYTR